MNCAYKWTADLETFGANVEIHRQIQYNHYARTVASYSLASTPPGMPGHIPPIFWLGGDVNGNIPVNIITYFWI